VAVAPVGAGGRVRAGTPWRASLLHWCGWRVYLSSRRWISRSTFECDPAINGSCWWRRRFSRDGTAVPPGRDRRASTVGRTDIQLRPVLPAASAGIRAVPIRVSAPSTRFFSVEPHAAQTRRLLWSSLRNSTTMEGDWLTGSSGPPTRHFVGVRGCAAGDMFWKTRARWLGKSLRASRPAGSAYLGSDAVPVSLTNGDAA